MFGSLHCFILIAIFINYLAIADTSNAQTKIVGINQFSPGGCLGPSLLLAVLVRITIPCRLTISEILHSSSSIEITYQKIIGDAAFSCRIFHFESVCLS